MTQPTGPFPSFEYDRTAPVAFRETRIDKREGAFVHNVSYANYAGERVTAYWVTPGGNGSFPAILYVHPAPGNKDNFLDEAVTLAQHGAASLLIDAPWSQEAWGQQLAQPHSAYDALMSVVKDLRRAVDVVLAQPNVDASRIAYVGHSFGALFGGVLSGVEKRVKAYALLAGTGSFADVAVLNMPDIKGTPMEGEYKQAMAPIDPIRYIGNAAPATLLFQFGERDDFPRENMMSSAEAGSAPKKVIWYDADHYGVNEVGRDDRIEWLSEQLGLE